ncbi:MAG: glycosyltransferase family 39 protein [Candidatus Marinimicrobia bacterium]|nr:glycosyltransferase family 39 protein [Candidatus Neomarinimicrobiota bacterium]
MLHIYKFISKPLFLLFVTLIVGGIFRLTNLSTIPSGFHGDEAAYGYNAYSILTTGTDEYGEHFPLILKSFEDYKPALYSYIDMPFVAILGLTETATRLPSALFGTLTIPLLYYLVKELFPKEKTISILSALLLAISPWHIMLSRSTSEVVVSLFFLLILFLSLFRLKKSFPNPWFFIAIISGSLSLATYTASRIFVPILIIIVSLMSIQIIGKKIKFPKPIIAVFIIILMVEFAYNFVAVNNRFNQVSIFYNPLTKLRMEEQIREDEFAPVLITRFFHNKIINYARTVLDNFSRYFSLDFLILNGGLPLRQRIPDVGLFYIWEIIFLFIGLFSVFLKYPKKGIILMGLWLGLLIPSAVTYDDVPNVYRALVIVPIMVIFISIGMKEGFRKLLSWNRYYAIVCLMILLCLSLYETLYFTHQYVTHTKKHQPYYRDYPMKNLIYSLNTYSPKFEKIIMTKYKTSYIHILFFNKIDPHLYQASGSNMDKDNTGFDKYLFIPKECTLGISKEQRKEERNNNWLYVNAGFCAIPEIGVEVLKTIYWEDGNPAFQILSYTK